jgi:hypothetical protein
MTIALYLAGFALVGLGLAGLVVPGLPGPPLLVLGVVLIAWAGGFQRIGWPTIGVTLLLAALMMIVDLAASLLGARKMGASGWGLAGATLGLIAGMFFGLPGILLGPPLGAFALEYAKDPAFKRAAKAGAGVALGFLLGTIGKLALAAMLVGVLAWAWFV